PPRSRPPRAVRRAPAASRPRPPAPAPGPTARPDPTSRDTRCAPDPRGGPRSAAGAFRYNPGADGLGTEGGRDQPWREVGAGRGARAFPRLRGGRRGGGVAVVPHDVRAGRRLAVGDGPGGQLHLGPGRGTGPVGAAVLAPRVARLARRGPRGPAGGGRTRGGA